MSTYPTGYFGQPLYQQYPNYPGGMQQSTPFAPYPNYYGLQNNIVTFPGPQIINSPGSAYTYNPFFDGYYAHNTQTSPYDNYLFDIVNSFQNEAIQQNPGGGYWPLQPWGGNFQ
jgi:hypothetical protein